MNSWKRPLRLVLGLVGYSEHRWPPNRFDGMQDALLLLRRSGYSPGVITGDVVFVRRDSALLADRSWA